MSRHYKINANINQQRFALFALLCLFWVVLSGVFSLQLIIAMFASSATTVYMVEKMGIMPNIKISKRGLKYIPYMLKSMAISSMQTIRMVSKDNPSFSSKIKVISFPKLSSGVNTLMHAAAITMTPGTTVIAVDKKRSKMVVHALSGESLSSLPDQGAVNVINKVNQAKTGKTKLQSGIEKVAIISKKILTQLIKQYKRVSKTNQLAQSQQTSAVGSSKKTKSVSKASKSGAVKMVKKSSGSASQSTKASSKPVSSKATSGSKAQFVSAKQAKAGGGKAVVGQKNKQKQAGRV